LRAVGIEDTSEARAVFPSIHSDVEAAATADHDHEGPLVVLHPGTSRFGAFKQWPVDRWGRLARALAHEMDARVLVTWGPGEEDAARDVAWLSDHRAICPATRTLHDLVALIRHADVFIGSDSGPTCIADALGVPTVALFGPKDPRVYGPRSARSRVVRCHADCSPCGRRSCPDPICMTGITPEQVLESVCEVLSAGGEA
jgi:ADP-heptose:LPS heptosyltransferase